MKHGSVLIKGYQGIGDNFYQRPAIRWALTNWEQVYLETSWPDLYWDMQLEETNRLHFIDPRTTLRTQKENVEKSDSQYCQDVPPRYDEMKHIYYGIPELKARRNPVRCFIEMLGGPPDLEVDFEFPLKPEWLYRAGDTYRSAFNVTPGQVIQYSFLHPSTLRREWKAPSRSPKPEYMTDAMKRIPGPWISCAHLKKGKEWLEHEIPEGVTTFHGGEVSIPVMAALVKMARISVAPVGFMLPMVCALRAPALLVWGGQVAPGCLFDESMLYPELVVAEPCNPCNCVDHGHDCDKTLQWEKAMDKVNTVLK